MRSSFRDFFTGLRQSFKFHYLWRGFFYDRIYAGIQNLSEKANRLSSLLLIFYTGAVAVLIAVNGAARIILHGEVLLWTEELSLWLLTGICFIGSGIAIRKGLHVGITIIIEFAPACIKRMLVFMGNLFITIFLLCLIAVSFVSALNAAGETGKMLKIPLVIPYMQIPLGSVLILFQMLPFLAGPLLKDADPEKYLLTRILPGE
ncbi:MAG: TRAP transporter small permease [Spirochaetales bacterium]|jgi:TRAP-type C4-dicarboxylate transport system permease small subunit|nr:TRAP transporter small permease [Spirochaetales bacterium]